MQQGKGHPCNVGVFPCCRLDGISSTYTPTQEALTLFFNNQR